MFLCFWKHLTVKVLLHLEIFLVQQPLFLRPLKKPHIGSFNANLDATSKRFNCSKSENIHTLLTTAGLCP